MRSVILVLIAALALPALLAGCTTTDNGGDEADVEADVEMKNSKFLPKTLEVEVGETVVWENLDSFEHTVTPFGEQEWGTEGQDDMFLGDTFSHTFSEPGTYEYRCIPHSYPDGDGGWDGMVGTVVVGGGDAADDTADSNETDNETTSA